MGNNIDALNQLSVYYNTKGKVLKVSNDLSIYLYLFAEL